MGSWASLQTNEIRMGKRMLANGANVFNVQVMLMCSQVENY